MIFDFTDYTYSGLLSILAALYGVGYPLIIQSIERIYSQYDSTRLSNRFTKETVYKIFRSFLVINLIYGILCPFLYHAGWWNMGFVTVQATLLVALIGTTFLLFQLIIKYGNGGELLKHIEGSCIDKSNVMDIFDIAIYADLKKNHTLFVDCMRDVFLYIESQQNIVSTAGFPKYDETTEKIIQKIRDYLREDDGHHMLYRKCDIVSVLYNSLSSSRLGLQSHMWMWWLLNEVVTYNNRSWFKQYWLFADSYSSMIYRFVSYNDELYKDKNYFMLRHVMIGALLIHNRRYNWFNDIFFCTHTEPEYYGLIPSTFEEVIYMLECIDRMRSDWGFHKHGFYFADDTKGVKDEDYLFRETVRYLSLLNIRLWSMQDMQEGNCTMPTSPCKIKDDERTATLMEMMIKDVEEYYSEDIFKYIPQMFKPEKQQVIEWLNKYKQQCLEEKKRHEEHPTVDDNKYEKLIKEVKDFAINYKPNLPYDRPNNVSWGGEFITTTIIHKQETIDTLHYSPYCDIGIGSLSIWYNFKIDLIEKYLKHMSKKCLKSVSIPESQVESYLKDIGYDEDKYEIISTYKIDKVESRVVVSGSLLESLQPHKFFILKKCDVPYVSFNLYKKYELKRVSDNSPISTNLFSFKTCNVPKFPVTVATKMSIHSNKNSKGVVYVEIKDCGEQKPDYTLDQLF